jgi:dihydrofolate synthase/folylpolyglutamate synthase
VKGKNSATFADALAWLQSTEPVGIKLGLDNTRRLLEATGNPGSSLGLIHVAGTNGKGSVCAMLDAALRSAGHRTGLYSSPHLIDFRERIRVDGQMISHEATAAGLSRLRDAVRDWDHLPTFFELTTALALDHFVREGCDVAVLETGMGGRLDSTNAITPLVSVITPIAMDHTAWLGETIAQIAAEKAGIIKPGVPVVSSPQPSAAAAVIATTARQLSAPLTLVETAWPGSVALAGPHQKWNAAAAAAALQVSGLSCPPAAMSTGFATVKWPARFQWLDPHTIVDGAHNLHSAEALVQTWREIFGNQKTTVIFGALQDKDYTSMLHALEPLAATFFFVPVPCERGAHPSGFPPLTSVPSQVFTSLASALDCSRHTNTRLIAGSLYLAGEAILLTQSHSPRSATDQ